MGAWLNYRKLATSATLPNSAIRAELDHLLPIDYVLDFPLAAQKTGDQRISVIGNWVLLGFVGSGTKDGGIVGSSFVAQIYVGKRRQGVALSDRPMNGANQFGTAQAVRWLRTPLWIPTQTPILVRVQNLDTTGTNNNIQIVLQGAGD